MASNLPDPDLSTLTSSSQIFSAPAGTPSYTLPQIRSLHKHIHVAIDDKQARLRTQVGGSYRELLGTADAIVRMRAEVDDAQGVLGRMGARCGRAVVGSKVAGLGRFAAERDGVSEDRFGRRSSGDAARAKVLAGCVLVLGGLLQGRAGLQDGDRLVTATKVLVLGSLLVKSFEETKPGLEVKSALGASTKSLEKLRRRLLRSIDRVLETVGENTNRDLLLKALCAHSLGTGSGTRDVIRHFLDVRGSAMASVFDVEEHRSSMDVVKGLELYTKTILDVQYLVPNRLPEALSSLRKETLLSDASLRGLESLRLDIYERWCGDEITEYKPSIRHDDLDGRQAVDMLTKWSAKGSEVLLHGLEKTLERTTEFKAITELRTEVLQLWIRDGGKARGSDPSVMLDKLRQTINAHVAGVLDGKVHKLRLVGSEVAATLEVWRAGVTDAQPSLWDTASLDMDLHHGAGPFALDVINRLYGRNDGVARAVTGYKSWAQVIDDVEEVVEQLKRQRWDNDVDEVEDEETIDQRQQALSRDDPAKLQERLHTALEKAFQDLDEHLSRLWDANKEGENSGRVAMYLLRILRDIRTRLPKLESVRGFGLGMVPPLQEITAATIAAAPVESFSSGGLARRKVVGRSLWEGDPELPTSPSPGVFRLLRDLTLAMGDAGTDLWSPAAVAVLRRHVSKELSGRWAAALEAHITEGKAKTEGEKSSVEAEVQSTEIGASVDTAKGTEDKAEDGTPTESADESKADKQDGEEAAHDSGTDEKPDAAVDPVTDKAEAVDESTTDKEAEATAEAALAERLRRDLLVQWLFDIAVLRFSISTAETSEELKELEGTIWKKTDLEGTSAQQRLNKASQEYWKRTSLLFGLLS
ncbi:putative sphingolipid c9-methyltransferase [Diaporthe ampelina]|uniref:Conserved oligomeric Golgi complex subunit 1 n=1 Tax=Diaporthe ampelina TaxID=1214573 RepID=A0A0G2IEP1_9PEZI|nr:putative sphingolipid c9-methyltransferase [Diaporthe ampelina]